MPNIEEDKEAQIVVGFNLKLKSENFENKEIENSASSIDLVEYNSHSVSKNVKPARSQPKDYKEFKKEDSEETKGEKISL